MVEAITTIKILLLVYSAQLECKSMVQPVEILCKVNPTHLNDCNSEWQEKEGDRHKHKYVPGEHCCNKTWRLIQVNPREPPTMKKIHFSLSKYWSSSL